MKRLLGFALLAACGGGEPKAPAMRADVVGVNTAPVATVTLTPALVAIKTNDTLQLVPILKDSAGNILTGRLIIWAASNGNVSVTQTGLVVGKSTNHANVTATSEGKIGLSSIYIIWSTTVTPSTITDTVGRTVQLTTTLRDRSGGLINSTPPTGAPITWSSNNVAVATVSGTGLVTGRTNGIALVKATSGGISGTATVSVVGTAPPPPSHGIAGVTVTPTSVAGGLVPGLVGIVHFTATVVDSSGAVVVKSVAWSSSDATVATVDTTGAVLLIGIGTATITATVAGFHASGQVTVSPPAPRVFNGVYADVAVRNGRFRIVRQDSEPPILVMAGDTAAAGFRVRTSTAPLHAAAVRQLASDLASRSDTLRFGTVNAVSVDSIFCAAVGCWITVLMPSHAPWTSTPPLGVTSLIGLAHALEAAARGDTLFTPGDSLPYIRVLP